MMQNFLSAKDIDDVEALAKEVLEIKKSPFKWKYLGENKTLVLIFLNSSLRTRLSTQKAAQNLGMNTIVLNLGQDSWNMEYQENAVMNGNTAEHIKEAAAVISQYADIIALRSFPTLTDKVNDYQEFVLNQFIKYIQVPLVNMESSTVHPLQSLTDLATIREFSNKKRPKVVLTWAPHIRALPQCVSNSFAQWMNKAEVDFIITNPEGYDLAKEFRGNTPIIRNQTEAFKDADFIYAKNWSSYEDYGKILKTDLDWMITEEKMNLTNTAKFMHCLPVRRNVVVSDGVLDSPQSIVIQQAGNREWAAQAVIKRILEGNLFSG
ncbi:MAG: acetylornithine carbamoyltransferase [Chitinophagales bacterium]|nr:acetylornithine carbamoyltransferase [Chitinophagales bacterium]MCZ2394708.1 acetylornithine carbamoyltransferase [Chitinophagales bacterium]